MRQSRAPTASQIQVSEWPPSPVAVHDEALTARANRTPLHHHPQPSPADSSGEEALVRRREPSESGVWLTDMTALGHALRRNAAGAFGPDLAKKLTQLVKMEKNVMRSLELVAKERMEVAVCRRLSPSHITSQTNRVL